MYNLKRGDIVARKSYKSDVFFQIVDFHLEKGDTKAILKGLDVRLLADSPVSDLEKITQSQLREFRKKFIQVNNRSLNKINKMKQEINLKTQVLRGRETNNFFEIPVKVLHMDGNSDYLRLCIDLYKELGLNAKGVHLEEKEQPQKVIDLLKKYRPDFLVLTGHDGFFKGKKDFKKVQNYRNSKHFLEAVRNARCYEPNKDDLVIIAGACQSHYESLLKAGANFASSPMRVFIHALDPVYIVEKIYLTSTSETVSIHDVIENTVTGIDGIGGIQTRGKLRLGFPKSPY